MYSKNEVKQYMENGCFSENVNPEKVDEIQSVFKQIVENEPDLTFHNTTAGMDTVTVNFADPVKGDLSLKYVDEGRDYVVKLVSREGLVDEKMTDQNVDNIQAHAFELFQRNGLIE